MQIDAEHNALFMLVRSGLWETAVEPPSLPLSDDSWSRIFEIARNQTVSGIAYRGLQYLPDEMLPPMQVMMRWMAEVDRMERTSHAIDTANIQLSQLFQSQGLTPITVKGQGVARLYEHPELRQAGDIDLFFTTKEEFEKAVTERWKEEQPWQRYQKKLMQDLAVLDEEKEGAIDFP